ncbi:UNVERIFIED_CONTAM: hypothetical protein HDU68_000210 [Siphonaria sp. JEL0065]|nr:hypothetical protein HDU68_000210 [Siphonaria sp. JEL0065]
MDTLAPPAFSRERVINRPAAPFASLSQTLVQQQLVFWKLQREAPIEAEEDGNIYSSVDYSSSKYYKFQPQPLHYTSSTSICLAGTNKVMGTNSSSSLDSQSTPNGLRHHQPKDPSNSHEFTNDSNHHTQPNPTFSVVHLETRAEAWTLSCSQQSHEFQQQQHVLYSYNSNLTFCEDNEEADCLSEEEYYQESGVLVDNQDVYGNQRQWTQCHVDDRNHHQTSSISAINAMDRHQHFDAMVPSLIHNHKEKDGDLNSNTSSAGSSVDDDFSETNSGIETRRQSEVDFGVYVQEVLKARKMAKSIVAQSNGGDEDNKFEYSSSGDGIGAFDSCGRRIGGAMFDNNGDTVDEAVNICNTRRRFGRDLNGRDKEEGDTDGEEEGRCGWNGLRNGTTKILSPTPKAPLTSIVKLLTRY